MPVRLEPGAPKARELHQSRDRAFPPTARRRAEAYAAIRPQGAVGPRVTHHRAGTVAEQAVRVLVVEDHPTFRAALVTALEQRGHDVAAFESAERAWDAWQQAPFPLVLLDRSLPGMDGLAFCRRLRSDEHGRSSVIVILTGSLDPSDLAEVLECRGRRLQFQARFLGPH